MPKQQIEIDVPEGYEVEVNHHDCPMNGCSGQIVYDFKKKQPEFIEVREYLYQSIHGHIQAGIVSKSGTLTYEAADQVAKAGLGISTAVGIGGDPIIGTTTKEAVELFMNDEDTDAIVMIGEIGGGMEAEAARFIQASGNKKPVVGFIAGQTAPPGRRMGHAGAIVGGADDTAAAKMKIMKECGIAVVSNPAHIGKQVAEVMKITSGNG